MVVIPGCVGQRSNGHHEQSVACTQRAVASFEIGEAKPVVGAEFGYEVCTGRKDLLPLGWQVVRSTLQHFPSQQDRAGGLDETEGLPYSVGDVRHAIADIQSKGQPLHFREPCVYSTGAFCCPYSF